MQLSELEIFIVGNPPPGFGGRYFIFVKLKTDCGIVGYGECYAASVGPTAMKAVIEDVFARHMQGEDPTNIELMFRRAYSVGFTQRPDLTVMGAFSGLEIACWDILGKARGVPIYKLLGGLTAPRLRSYTYLYPSADQDPVVFYGSPELSAARAKEMVDLGFTAVKFDPAGPYTIFGGHQPSMSDLDRSEAVCREVRAAVGSRADLLFGTHGQFTTSGAIRMGRRVEAYDPLWFEEPVPPDNPLEMAAVAQACRIPIATGERLTTKYEFAQVLRAGAAHILQPALGRVGGIWAANIQLGASIPNLLMLETIGTGEGFHRDLLRGEIVWENGHIIPPTKPGLGVELNEEFARAHPYKGDKLHLEMQQSPMDYSPAAVAASPNARM